MYGVKVAVSSRVLLEGQRINNGGREETGRRSRADGTRFASWPGTRDALSSSS